MKRGWWVFFAFLSMTVLVPEGMCDSAPDAFLSANSLYRDEKFSQAAEAYQQLIRKHPDDAVLFYNLANTHFRQKQLGLAILNYERAKLRNPRHPDTNYNLRYAEGLLEYRIKDKRNWMIRGAEDFFASFTVDEALLLFLVVLSLFLICWFAMLALIRGENEWGSSQKGLFLAALVTFTLYAGKWAQVHLFHEAIVLNKGVEVRYGPTESDQVAMHLGEGLKVYIVDRRDGWSRVGLVNGEGGWVNSNQIAEIRQKVI